MSISLSLIFKTLNRVYEPPQNLSFIYLSRVLSQHPSLAGFPPDFVALLPTCFWVFCLENFNHEVPSNCTSLNDSFSGESSLKVQPPCLCIPHTCVSQSQHLPHLLGFALLPLYLPQETLLGGRDGVCLILVRSLLVQMKKKATETDAKRDLIAICIFIPNPCVKVSSLLHHLFPTCALLYTLAFYPAPASSLSSLQHLFISLSCILLSICSSASFSLYGTSSMCLTEDGAWFGYQQLKVYIIPM